MTDRADRIELRGLRAFGRHGVLPHERTDGQVFVVDIALELDQSAAAAGDDLAATVDYGVVARQVVEVVAGPPADLIETVAQRIADVCLASPRVQAVEVTVHKPTAPIDVPFEDVAVSIRRTRR